jgi:FdhD protein
MNLVNHSVHAAAWVSPDGSIAIVREDVGRHNALDKLIGAVYAAGIDVHGGFVLMTSRCSFELVQKCALSGIGALVTVSAPTALALDLARASGLYLAALGRDEPVVFNP